MRLAAVCHVRRRWLQTAKSDGGATKRVRQPPASPALKAWIRCRKAATPPQQPDKQRQRMMRDKGFLFPQVDLHLRRVTGPLTAKRMHTLHHYPLCPKSRSIRLVLAELDLPFSPSERQPWRLDQAFLALNPAGELPVLQVSGGPALCGTYSISEYVADELKRHPIEGLTPPLFPGNREARAEVRRLVDWAHHKMAREATGPLLEERVFALFDTRPNGARRGPDANVLRAARANVRYHFSYFNHLAHGRRWLAGEDLSFADLAAAAQLSVLDYLGEVPWDDQPAARAWYQRVKSRPSFKPLLSDRVPGLKPPPQYDDLDF